MNSGLRDMFARISSMQTQDALYRSSPRQESGTETADLLSKASYRGGSRTYSRPAKTGGCGNGPGTGLLTLSTSFNGVAGSLEKEGLRGVEQDLTNRYLAHIVSRGLHPLVRVFFSRVIDARNILALFKALRMSARARPAFLPGGSMTSERFRDILKNDDLFAVKSLVRKQREYASIHPTSRR
jgi:hypothetical protein